MNLVGAPGPVRPGLSSTPPGLSRRSRNTIPANADLPDRVVRARACARNLGWPLLIQLKRSYSSFVVGSSSVSPSPAFVFPITRSPPPSPTHRKRLPTRLLLGSVVNAGCKHAVIVLSGDLIAERVDRRGDEQTVRVVTGASDVAKRILKSDREEKGITVRIHRVAFQTVSVLKESTRRRQAEHIFLHLTAADRPRDCRIPARSVRA